MSRILMSGFALMAAIEALRTVVVLRIAVTELPIGVGTASGLFAFFFALTATAAYFIFSWFKAHLARQRKTRLAPGAGAPVAKETVILRYAPEWGLSQAEADVAIFVVKGFSNNEIADMRGCAIATVKSQLGRIYQKSGLDSRYQLIGFVTDEVCSMACEQDDLRVRVSTRNALPLAGRVRSSA